MPIDYIAAQLQAYHDQAKEGKLLIEEIKMESPMERARREIQQEIARNEAYRASILQHVPTFAGSGLTPEAIMTAARSMDEVYYKKGDIIIQQDDIGDSFFVLEEGVVSVTRKQNFKDPNEVPRELAKLSNNAHFGDIALLTAEPRSATVTVISDEAKCLRMTKLKFDELLATSNKIVAENRKQIGQNVLDTVPLFKSMTTVNKRKLLEAMIPMTYLSSSYICRQGTTGNTFFILTDGTCRVTINQPDNTEKEVARLHPGDYFGEVALIETSNRRTANVISVDAVSCLTLNRNDFNRLLKSLKVKLLEQQAIRSSANQQSSNSDDHGHGAKQLSTLAQKRRISGFNTHGQRDDMRIACLLKRTGAFMTISLWNSLYSRYYRDLLLDPNKLTEYGKYAAFIFRANDLRYETVSAIREQVIRILEMDPGRRTASEHAFILGLMRQRNQLKDKLCKTWPGHQYQLLCRKLKLVRAKAFRKIIEVDSKGTVAFLIIRGAVRIYSRVQRMVGDEGGGNSGGNSKTFYEEDLFPGEVFAESALSGMHTRMITAMAMTDVDLITIDDQDFMMAQDRASVTHMGTEEKSKFLMAVPIFRGWDSYKLLRLAHVLTQEEVEKNTVLIAQNSVSKDMFFITSGRVDVLDSLTKRHLITTLQLQDYFGESGFCNRFVKAINNKVTEEFCHIATSKVELLVLQEQYFNLFDSDSINLIRTGFLAKLNWRRDRVEAMRWERAKVRKQQKIMELEAEYLPYLRRKEEANSNDSDNSKGGEPLMGPSTGDNKYNQHPVLPAQQPAMTTASVAPAFAAADRNTITPSRKNSNKKQPDDTSHLVAMAKADLAYKAALVHPLDEHLQNAKVWIPPPHDSSRLLKNLEDIPSLLNRDYDMLMVSSSCRDQRTVDRIHDQVLQARRPLSALLHNNHHHHSHGHLDAQQTKESSPIARPSSAPAATLQQSLVKQQSSFISSSTSMSIDTRFYNTYGFEGGRSMSAKEARRLHQQKLQQERDARFANRRPLSGAVVPSALMKTNNVKMTNTDNFQSSWESSIPPMIIHNISNPNDFYPQSQQHLRPVSAPTTQGISASFTPASLPIANPRMTLRVEVAFQRQVGTLYRNNAFPQMTQKQAEVSPKLLVRPMSATEMQHGQQLSPHMLSRQNSSMLMRFDPDFVDSIQEQPQLDYSTMASADPPVLSEAHEAAIEPLVENNQMKQKSSSHNMLRKRGDKPTPEQRMTSKLNQGPLLHIRQQRR